MRSYPMLFLLIILTFVIMPLAVAWQSASDPIDIQQQQEIDLLNARVATLEAWVFTPIPPATPTQELTNQQLALVGNLIRNVRVCPSLACDFAYALPAGSDFWFRWAVAVVIADGFAWVQLCDGNWTTISKGNSQYVTLQERYRTSEGC